MGRAHTGAREKREEEGTAEKCFGLTAAPNLPAKPSEWDRRTSEEGRSEAEPGKKGWRLVRKAV